MKASSVNLSGPLNLVVGTGPQHRDGARKNPDADFAGLMSQLSVKIEAADAGKSAQPQPFVAGKTIDTMLAGVPDTLAAVPDTHTASVAVQAHDPGDSLQGMGGQVIETMTGDASVAVGDANVSQDELALAMRSEVEIDVASLGDLPARDATASTTAGANAQPAEMQTLLSSLMQSTPLQAVTALPRASAKAVSAVASAAAVLLPGARTRTGSEGMGIATQAVAREEQTPDAQSSLDMAWLEPVAAGVDPQGDLTAPRGKEQGLPPALVSDTKISVLQTQTHHAPVIFGGPMAQIADGLRVELAASGDTALTWSPSVSATAKPASVAPVKVLHIQLQPADLGTVTVRMSLKEDALELHIEASQQETAQRLQQDQDSLSKVLRSAGYIIDSAAIRVVEPDRSSVAPGQGSGSLSQSSYQGTAGGAPSQGGASQGRAQDEGAARGHARESATGGAGGQQRPSSNGLYV